MESWNEQLAKRYLLGDMPEEQRDGFEEKYFADDRAFEELRISEAELIDSFVKGELSESEVEHFRVNYLTSSERREKVETAECLMAVVSKTTVANSAQSRWSWLRKRLALPPARQLGYGMAALALLGIAAITLLKDFVLRTELTRMQGEKVQLIQRGGELEQELSKLKNNAGSLPQNSTQTSATLPLIASITLLPGGQRGPDGKSSVLIVPRNARWVELILPLQHQDHFSEYSAVVETATGNKVCQWESLRSQLGTDGGNFVRVGFPAESVVSNTYVVRLSGSDTRRQREEIEDYTFQLLRP